LLLNSLSLRERAGVRVCNKINKQQLLAKQLLELVLGLGLLFLDAGIGLFL
jgi:hypothetical protein